jgi:hypothetical protein
MLWQYYVGIQRMNDMDGEELERMGKNGKEWERIGMDTLQLELRITFGLPWSVFFGVRDIFRFLIYIGGLGMNIMHLLVKTFWDGIERFFYQMKCLLGLSCQPPRLLCDR